MTLDCVATENEYQEIIDNELDYYKFLGIDNRINRLNNNKSDFKSISDVIDKKYITNKNI